MIKNTDTANVTAFINSGRSIKALVDDLLGATYLHNASDHLTAEGDVEGALLVECVLYCYFRDVPVCVGRTQEVEDRVHA